MQNSYLNKIISYLSSKGGLSVGLVVKERQNPKHPHLQDVRIVKVSEKVSLTDLQRLQELNVHKLPKVEMYQLLTSLEYVAKRRSLDKSKIATR